MADFLPSLPPGVAPDDLAAVLRARLRQRVIAARNCATAGQADRGAWCNLQGRLDEEIARLEALLRAESTDAEATLADLREKATRDLEEALAAPRSVTREELQARRTGWGLTLGLFLGAVALGTMFWRATR